MRPQQVGAFPIALILGCLLSLSVFSQEKIKFGRVDPKDFSKTGFEQDTGAHAVIISDIGESTFESDRTNGLVLQFKRHTRIKIVDKNGYEAATIKIPYYKGETDEIKLKDIKATTYNLEGTQVVETKMDSKSIFTDKIDKKGRVIQKFTLPAVKEGSIIEYTYTIVSPYKIHLHSWQFQDTEYPTLYSRYEVVLPEFYEYIFLRSGYVPIKENKSGGHQSFTIAYEEENSYGGKTGHTQYYNINSNTTNYKWEAENIPALREEEFTTSIWNHVSMIQFQLSAYRYPDQPVKPVLGTWGKLAEELNKEEFFGEGLNKNNPFLSDKVEELTKGLSNDTAKARRIYNYVRSNFTCTSHDDLYLSKSLKSTFTSHNGNDADINLLLVAMLRKAGMNAHPVILSTRENGVTYEMYPLIGRFNYTIAALNTDSSWYFLDASEPYLGFGRLDYNAYNGHARILSPDVIPINMDPNTLLEAKSTYVMLMGDSGKIKGSFSQKPTYYESCKVRADIAKNGKDAYFKPLAKGFSMETTVSNGEINDVEDYEIPVEVKYDFEMSPDDAGMLYINPMLSEAYKGNPFKSLERRYPVEMPYLIDELYTLNMIVPEGYEVEELPKSTMVKLNEEEGLFQYLIQQSEGTVQFRSRIKLNKAVFTSEDYSTLRDFFDMIVKKQSEQIVLKKKA
jgi:transglutaminase-like putative cysteine protease